MIEAIVAYELTNGIKRHFYSSKGHSRPEICVALSALEGSVITFLATLEAKYPKDMTLTVRNRDGVIIIDALVVEFAWKDVKTTVETLFELLDAGISHINLNRTAPDEAEPIALVNADSFEAVKAWRGERNVSPFNLDGVMAHTVST